MRDARPPQTARRFYKSNGYVEEGPLAGIFGTAGSYLMSKPSLKKSQIFFHGLIRSHWATSLRWPQAPGRRPRGAPGEMMNYYPPGR
jgi:hypothetical protein